MAFVAFGPQAAGTLNGLPVGPDRVLASTSGIEVEFVVAGGYESVSFFLPPDDILAHLRGRHREDEFRIPNGVELLQPSPAAAQELYGFGRRLADVAARQPEVFDVPQTQTAAQIDLLETLLATLGSAGHVESAAEDLTRQAHSRVVQVAEDFALVAHRRTSVRDRPVRGSRGERADLAVRFQGGDGNDPGRLPDPTPAASGTSRAANSDASLDYGDDRSAPLGLLALRRLFPCLQGLLWRVAVGHPTTEATRFGQVGQRGCRALTDAKMTHSLFRWANSSEVGSPKKTIFLLDVRIRRNWRSSRFPGR